MTPVPYCDAPSLSPLLVGALMRHYRTRAGLTLQQASNLVGISSSRIKDLETARVAVPVTSARTLLDVYGAPAHEIRRALALLARPGHRHQIDDVTSSPAWVEALVAGSRSVHAYGTDPASLCSLAASPASGPTGRRPAARCRWVMFLSEDLLEPSCDQHPSADHLSHLVRLAYSGSISVHLVPGQLEPRAPLVTEYTYTARGWTGSVADRLRRQIYVTHHADGARRGVRNGSAAVAERQLLQQAARTALPFQWTLHQLRRVARAPQQSTAVTLPLTDSGGHTVSPAAPTARASTVVTRPSRTGMHLPTAPAPPHAAPGVLSRPRLRSDNCPNLFTTAPEPGDVAAALQAPIRDRGHA
ncbi:helix-turn-helix domain-containing protein [Streptomyces sp. NPDC056160]|uniref:helix-turn-helix domain-containing protein n=1 Tax=Streptomyces sp. NPDC056160 TaxID=3345731 RepID=UPI0035DB1AD2